MTQMPNVPTSEKRRYSCLGRVPLACCWGGLLLLCCASIPGCQQRAEPGASGRTRHIILLTNGDDPFWDAMRHGMNQAEVDLRLAEANLTADLDKGDFSEEAQISKLPYNMPPSRMWPRWPSHRSMPRTEALPRR